MTDCVFCPIPPNATILLERDGCVVFQPLNPVTPGHALVVPREHVADFMTDWEVAARVVGVASYFCQQMRVAGVIEDCNLITSSGEAATQTVFHLHMHIVPREPGDGLHLPWTGQHVPGR